MCNPPEAVPPWKDTIVVEVRTAREALLTAAGNDVVELCRRLREEQARSPHRLVSRRPMRATAPADDHR